MPRAGRALRRIRRGSLPRARRRARRGSLPPAWSGAAAARSCDAIGDTPLVMVDGIWVKLEYLNPSGSIKARIAKYMIERAGREGLLRPGDTIVEASSGNTGNAMSMVAAVKGYRMLVVMPDGMSGERVAISRAFGAQVMTLGDFHVNDALAKVRELGREPGQFAPQQSDPDRGAFVSLGDDLEQEFGAARVDLPVAESSRRSSGARPSCSARASMPDFVGRPGPAYPGGAPGAFREGSRPRVEPQADLAARCQPAQPLDLAHEVQIEPHPGVAQQRAEVAVGEVRAGIADLGRQEADCQQKAIAEARKALGAARGLKRTSSAKATRRPPASRQAAVSWLKQLIQGTAATRAHGHTGCACACRFWHFPLVHKLLTSNVCVRRLPDLPAICGSPATLRSYSPRILRVDSFTL
jgi:hypothetical protein